MPSQRPKPNTPPIPVSTMDQGQPADQPPILSDRVIVNGAETSLTFTADGKLRWLGAGQSCFTVEKQVLGFSVEGPEIRIKAVVERREGICCTGGKGDLMRTSFVFQPLSQESHALWSRKLREFIDSLGRPKSLFVFMNPFGGKKSATKIFLEDVRPFLEDADIQFTVEETKYQLHAKEVVNSLDLSKYDGIVCVSGDGVLVEVVNGLLEREDWRDAIRMPLGVVPAGTGNGMAKSLLDAAGEPCVASNAIVSIIRGHKRLLDVATMVQGEKRFFSVLMLAWGLVADIDIESEKYRWMGSARIDFYAIQRIFRLRRYSGCISFVPAPGYEDYGEPRSCDGASTSEKKSNLEEAAKVQQLGYVGPDVKLEDLEWRTISGPFVSVWLHNVPWGSRDVMAAPDAKFSDGYLDLVMIRDCPRLSLLSLMSELNTGGHVKSPYVTYVKVKAFALEPGARVEDPSKEGFIDADGEVLARGKGTYKGNHKSLMAYDKLEITVEKGLATLFSPVS